MASINKILSKVNQATSAINSIKGVKSKIQGKGYTANVDKLLEQSEEAKRKLDKRRQSLQKNQDAANKAKSLRKAKLPPSPEVSELVYPLGENLYNYIHFSIRPRRNRGTKNGQNLLNDSKTEIYLYIPENLTNPSNAKYQEGDVGSLARSFLGRADGAVGGTSLTDNEFIDGLSTVVQEGMNKLINAVTGDVVNFAQGQAVNPMKEMMFQGVDFRSFQFSFVFQPRSQEEADRVEDIIYLFKTAMLPDTFGSDESSSNVENYFNYPNLVDVSWEGQCAKHMDGFLPSVITACDVKYNNGGKFATFETGQPLNITMDLTIQEIKILTQETYQQIACEGSEGRLHRPDTSIGEGTPSILDTNRTGG